jgi:hypothetical protein
MMMKDLDWEHSRSAKSWVLNLVGGLGRSRKYFNGITIR